MPSSVIASRANDGALHDLIALRYRWRVEEGGESGRSLEDFEEAFVTWFGQHRSSHVGYIVARDNEVIGCAWLFVIDRVPGPGKFIRRAGMLQSVYVVPEHRDAGAG